MVTPTGEIADLECKAQDAERMARKSPFMKDRKRFADIATEYRQRADSLRG